MKGNLSNVKFIYTGSTLLRCQFSPNRPLCMHVLSYFSRVSNSATLWTVAHQASLSMGFPRQEDWSGLPCPSPGDLPHQGIELASPVLVGGFFTPESAGKPAKFYTKEIFYQAFCRGTSFSEATLQSTLVRASTYLVLNYKKHK